MIQRARVGHVVRSTVDSENTFGVPVRQDFLCRVEVDIVKDAVIGSRLEDRAGCELLEETATMLDDTMAILRRREIRDEHAECEIYARAPLAD
jgi:hypothetical protein